MIPHRLSVSDFCIGSMYESTPDEQSARRCLVGHCNAMKVPNIFRRMLTFQSAMSLIDPRHWYRLSRGNGTLRAFSAAETIAKELERSKRQITEWSKEWPVLVWVKTQCNDEQGPRAAAAAWNRAVAMFERHQMGGVP